MNFENQDPKVYQPNTTQIPNIILDYWMRVLGNAEFKVLLCICRKTFGWHKKRDRISKKQICEITGLSKDIVRKAIRNLQDQNLINCYESTSEWGDSEPNLYEINVIAPAKDNDIFTSSCEEKGVGLPASPPMVEKEEGVSLLTSPGGGLAHKQGVGLPASPTKQSLTKPITIQKGNAAEPQNDVRKNKMALKRALPFSITKDRALKDPPLKQSSRRNPLTEDQAAIVAWLESQNIQEASYDAPIVYMF